jgi:hypothetical protein
VKNYHRQDLKKGNQDNSPEGYFLIICIFFHCIFFRLREAKLNVNFRI